ncbi:MAG: PAS domain S-box-containing protein [bacterium]|jgi:PAS domain S-box-containing protein
MAETHIPNGLFKAGLDHTINGICIAKKEDDDFIISYVNRAFCKITGYKESELLAQSSRVFSTTSIHFGLGTGTDAITVEGNLACKNNGDIARFLPVEMKLNHFKQKDTFFAMGSFLNQSELSQFKKENQQLQKAQESLFNQFAETTCRLASLLQNLPDIVFEIDRKLNFTFISDNVQSMFQYNPSEVINEPFEKFVSEREKNKLSKTFNFNSLDEVRGHIIHCVKKDGSDVVLEVSSNPVLDNNGEIIARLGTARDVTMLRNLAMEAGDAKGDMTLQVNEKLEVITYGDALIDILDQEFLNTPQQELSLFFVDSSVIPLFSFSFNQKEDVPFPVELKLKNNSGEKELFSVQFKFNNEAGLLEGTLIPCDTQSQVALIGQKIEQQDEALRSAVVVDPEMQAGIMKDSQNLAHEILDTIKALLDYSFEDDVFVFENFSNFFKNKNVPQYLDLLKILGNKVHGIKGTSGFLLPASKQLCHKIEEVTKPLADMTMLLTKRIGTLLREFIYKVMDLLDQYQKNPESLFGLENWMDRIDQAIKESDDYLADQVHDFQKYIQDRKKDSGQLRAVRKTDYLSVTQDGYNQLSQQVKSLFYMASTHLSEENLVQAGSLYNEFLDTHQKIKKVPLDLSRYERLIPSLADEYEKEAEFIFHDNNVCADKEFWNAMHEIFNHSLKNAVIHGLETKKDRLEMDKEKSGKVEVELQEDALQVYVSVRDDGAGIDINKITQKALENEVITKEQVKTMSSDEIFNLVFIQGVSTAEHVDDNAGRGVGLNAVQDAMNRFHGSCRIQSDLGKGTSWNFSFPKKNVSLPCFIVSLNNFSIAIPEEHVDSFRGYKNEFITHVNQRLSFRRGDEIIPLLEGDQLFDLENLTGEDVVKRILVLKYQTEKVGLVINDILHHAPLPILPLPEEYRDAPIYLGVTLHGNKPILVLNTSKII